MIRPSMLTTPATIKIIAAIVVAFTAYQMRPMVIVESGHRGVVSTFGKVSPEVLGEGLHWRWPIAQTVHSINVQIQKGEGAGDAASKDLQQVHTKIALNYHLIPDQVAQTFQAIGNLGTVGDRIIVPAVQEAVKATTARYTAEELIAKRQDVRDQIRSALNERMSRHGIAIDEFSIVNFNFSPSFNQAIEAKTTAEQLSLKAQRDLDRIKIEAQQKVATAQAEAQALTLQKQAVSPELIALRQAENQRLAIEKWDGKLPHVSGGAMPFISIDAKK